MDADTVLKQLGDQVIALTNQEAAVIGPASTFTADQKSLFFQALDLAQRNFVVAQNKLLAQDDIVIGKISQDAVNVQKGLDKSLNDLAALANQLNQITSALGIVSTALSVLA